MTQALPEMPDAARSGLEQRLLPVNPLRDSLVNLSSMPQACWFLEEALA